MYGLVSQARQRPLSPQETSPSGNPAHGLLSSKCWPLLLCPDSVYFIQILQTPLLRGVMLEESLYLYDSQLLHFQNKDNNFIFVELLWCSRVLYLEKLFGRA